MSDFFSFYKNYITINGRDFLWDDISVSNGKRLVVNNVNNIKEPVIQYLGEKETNFSITIKYGGILKTTVSEATQTIGDKEEGAAIDITNRRTKSTNKEGFKQSFLEQKNFLEKLLSSNEIITIVLPDGDIVKGVVSSNNVVYKNIGLNTVHFEFIKIAEQNKELEVINPQSLYDIKDQVFAKIFFQQQKSGFFAQLEEKINKMKSNIKNSKFSSQVASIANKLRTGYTLWRGGVNTIKSYVTGFQNILNNVQNKMDTLVTQFNEPSRILTMLGDVNTQIVNIAKTPGRIASSINDLCDAIVNYSNDTKKTFTFLSSMFDFSNDSIESKKEYYNLNSFYDEIIDNEVKNSLNLITFTNCLTTASEISYTTTEEIREVIKNIEKMYDSLMNNDSISNDLKEDLYKGFNNLKQILFNNSVSIKNIKEIEITQPKTLHQIVYDYYGDEKYFEDIILLNKDNIKDILFVQGKIKVFDYE